MLPRVSVLWKHRACRQRRFAAAALAVASGCATARAESRRMVAAVSLCTPATAVAATATCAGDTAAPLVRVAAIESSCDDSAAAVLDVALAHNCSGAGRVITRVAVRADVIAAQHGLHAPYAGVVPHFAARAHEVNLPLVVKAAMERAGGCGGDGGGTALPVGAVAVTVGPGLAACLRAGVAQAVALAERARVPIIPIHHLEAHLLVPRLCAVLAVQTQAAAAAEVAAAGSDRCGGRNGQASAAVAAMALPQLLHPLPFPYLVLLVSGGHSQLVLAHGVGDYEPYGGTLDDSLGEAYDKVARLLRVWLHVSLPAGGTTRADATSQQTTSRVTLSEAHDLHSKLTPADVVALDSARDQKLEDAGLAPRRRLHFEPFLQRERTKAAEPGNDGDDEESAAEAAALAGMAGHLGAAVEALAAAHTPTSPVRVAFPVPLHTAPRPSAGAAPAAFSFSGLKSAVNRWTRRPDVDVRQRATAAAGAAAFQAAAAAHLGEQLRRALVSCNSRADAAAIGPGPRKPARRVTTVVMCGGVAANAALRSAVGAAAALAGASLVVPPARYCTDNAVMVAWAAAERLAAGSAQLVDVRGLGSGAAVAQSAATEGDAGDPPQLQSSRIGACPSPELLVARARWPLSELHRGDSDCAGLAARKVAGDERAVARLERQVAAC
jgi:tRNA A37 threonylcarbamoyltransferase TsaD